MLSSRTTISVVRRAAERVDAPVRALAADQARLVRDVDRWRAEQLSQRGRGLHGGVRRQAAAQGSATATETPMTARTAIAAL